jgi:hypothetical protein
MAMSAPPRSEPYWLFFCDLERDDLKVMTFSCLPSVAAVQLKGQSKPESFRFLIRPWLRLIRN